MGKEIGMRIAKLRIDRDLTQAEMGKELSVSRDVIAKWESGDREIKASDVDRIATLFSVSCDYLIRGVSEKHKTVAGELGLTEESVKALEKCVRYNAHEALQLFNEMVLNWMDFTKLAILMDKSVQCSITQIKDDSDGYDHDTLPKDYDSLPQDAQWLEDIRCQKTQIALSSDIYFYAARETVAEIIDDIIGRRILPVHKRKVQDEEEAQDHAP